MDNPSVDIWISSVLSMVTGGRRNFQTVGSNVRESLDDLLEEVPALRVHLFDDTGALRPHILLFVGDTDIRWLDSLETGLKEGDTITVMQAVSGG